MLILRYLVYYKIQFTIGFSIDENILNQAGSFQMCGDWLIYLACLRGGKLAYDVSSNNYFRRHKGSVVSRVEGTQAYFEERFKVSEFVLDNYKTHDSFLIKISLTEYTYIAGTN